jgi:spermidine/putrescine-binding protein
MNKRIYTILTVLLVLSVLFTACVKTDAPQPTKLPQQIEPTKAQPLVPTESPKVGGQLNYLGWEGYDDQEAFKPFYDKTGVILNTTYIGGNDELITKFKAGGPGTYDVGDINARYFRLMVDTGMIIPLDESRLPNLKDLFPALKEINFGYYNGKLYAIPAFYSTSALCYRADLVSEPDWDFYKNPEFMGKYSVNNNPMGMVFLWAMALGLGQDATEWTQDDLAKIKARGMEEFKNAATMTTAGGGEMKDLLVRGDVVLTTDCWEQVALNAQEQGVDVRYVVPTGPVKANFDIYFIFNGAKNLDAAYAWINHAISKEAMAIMARNYGAVVTNQAAYDLMSADLRKKLGFDSLNALIKNTEMTIMPDSNAVSPYVTLNELLTLFEEIKSSNLK